MQKLIERLGVLVFAICISVAHATGQTSPITETVPATTRFLLDLAQVPNAGSIVEPALSFCPVPDLQDGWQVRYHADAANYGSSIGIATLEVVSRHQLPAFCYAWSMVIPQDVPVIQIQQHLVAGQVMDYGGSHYVVALLTTWSQERPDKLTDEYTTFAPYAMYSTALDAVQGAATLATTWEQTARQGLVQLGVTPPPENSGRPVSPPKGRPARGTPTLTPAGNVCMVSFNDVVFGPCATLEVHLECVNTTALCQTGNAQWAWDVRFIHGLTDVGIARLRISNKQFHQWTVPTDPPPGPLGDCFHARVTYTVEEVYGRWGLEIIRQSNVYQCEKSVCCYEH
jgi:hypothetical protein